MRYNLLLKVLTLSLMILCSDWQYYTRGSAEDYNRYAQITGDLGWSWANILPYFKKNERWTPPEDHHNTAGHFDPSVHGFDGVNSVSLAGYPTSIDGRVLQSARELKGEYDFNLDTNSGSPLGIGNYNQSNQRIYATNRSIRFDTEYGQRQEPQQLCNLVSGREVYQETQSSCRCEYQSFETHHNG